MSLRLLPFLFILYIVNFLDRTNVAIAALQMNRDLNFSAASYGLGVGVFYFGYAAFEVPSNLILVRVGARRWIARIMISWGVVATAMMFVRTPGQFYALRVLLGLAEAGFLPGILYYLTEWFPATDRARAIGRFMIGIPLSGVIGAPLSGWILGLDGQLGLRGWQWVFLIEGLPAVLLGVSVLFYLTDKLEDAKWLRPEQRAWLSERLRRESEGSQGSAVASLIRRPLDALSEPLIWLLAVPYFIYSAIGYVLIYWMAIVIRDTLHTSYAATGVIRGAIAVVGVIGMLVAGASSDRRSERFLHAAGGLVLAAIGCLTVAMIPSTFGLLAGLSMATFGMDAFLPAFWCIPTIMLRGTAAAGGIALVNSIGGLGGFAGPYAAGLLKTSAATTGPAFMALAVAALVTAGLLLLLQRQRGFRSLRPMVVAASGTT